jgi:hypothetical protein
VDDDCKTVGRALVFMDFFSSKGAESSNTDWLFLKEDKNPRVLLFFGEDCGVLVDGGGNERGAFVAEDGSGSEVCCVVVVTSAISGRDGDAISSSSATDGGSWRNESEYGMGDKG